MHHLLEISPELIRFGVIALIAWFAWDMRSILKASQHKNELSIEGDWEGLERLYQKADKPYRPFVWLHRRYLMPGTNTAQYALFLYQHGRLEEALAKVDEAIRQIDRKPRIFRFIHRDRTFTTLCSAFEARTLILTGLGRHHEARETGAQLQRIAGPESRFGGAIALLDYNCGFIDEALAQARAVPRGHKQYDAMRGLTIKVLCMKGQLDEALQEAFYTPSDATTTLSPQDLATLSAVREGAKLIELKNKKLAGIYQPARLIMMAQVYIAREEFAKADLALDEAEKTLGAEPAIQAAYCRYRANSLAAQGRATEAEGYIARLRTMAQQIPKRSRLWEIHSAIGRSYMYLRRYGDALSEYTEAQRHVLHPLEKHVTTYWLARANEAAGERREAARCYQAVAADAIPSWMQKEAAKALAGQNG